ncbi:hypothetical protein AAH476_13525 [Enterobacter cloacae subsp. cloacae]|uniref:hypothetical protein n=1 Tax=Enterobacter cloacae TaxID=550 RepID=UPI0013D82512|nr:hypothetical protein [Enterobacter cloacae]UJC67451.1 hypothetical protein J4G41_04380 [Enterobacter cloacae]
MIVFLFVELVVAANQRTQEAHCATQNSANHAAYHAHDACTGVITQLCTFNEASEWV